MWHWLGILIMASMILGCEAWEDFGDFIAHDDGGGTERGEPGELTHGNLDGIWDLELIASTLDDHVANTVAENTLPGVWDKEIAASTEDFLAPLLSDFSRVTALEITATDFIFKNDNSNIVSLSWDFTDTGGISLSKAAGNTDEVTVQATLKEQGTQLILVDDDDRRATFNFPEGTQAVQAYRLRIDGDRRMLITTITFRNEEVEETEQAYAIVNQTMHLTDHGDTVEIEAMLSDDNDTLIFVFPSKDDRGTAVFRR